MGNLLCGFIAGGTFFITNLTNPSRIYIGWRIYVCTYIDKIQQEYSSDAKLKIEYKIVSQRSRIHSRKNSCTDASVLEGGLMSDNDTSGVKRIRCLSVYIQTVTGCVAEQYTSLSRLCTPFSPPSGRSSYVVIDPPWHLTCQRQLQLIVVCCTWTFVYSLRRPLLSHASNLHNKLDLIVCLTNLKAYFSFRFLCF